MRWSLVRWASRYGALLGIAVLAAAACSDDGGTAGPEPTGTVQGSVEDETGAPVAGATVTLTRSGSASRTATSGGNGSFSFAQVEAGTWSLQVTAPGGYTVPSSQPNPQSITVTAGQTTTVTLKLARVEQGPPGAPPQAITVRMQGTAFVERIDTVAVGGTVTWRNDDPVAHNTTSDDDLWSSGTMQNGDSFKHTFDEAGSFPYSCTLHAGMTGTIVVRE